MKKLLLTILLFGSFQTVLPANRDRPLFALLSKVNFSVRYVPCVDTIFYAFRMLCINCPELAVEKFKRRADQFYQMEHEEQLIFIEGAHEVLDAFLDCACKKGTECRKSMVNLLRNDHDLLKGIFLKLPENEKYLDALHLCSQELGVLEKKLDK